MTTPWRHRVAVGQPVEAAVKNQWHKGVVTCRRGPERIQVEVEVSPDVILVQEYRVWRQGALARPGTHVPGFNARDVEGAPPAVCPITMDCVGFSAAVTPMGQVYSEAALRRWFSAGHDTDPATGAALNGPWVARWDGTDATALARFLSHVRGLVSPEERQGGPTNAVFNAACA
jgi:hypothetical protein